MTPRVLNLRRGVFPDAVLIDRRSPWGNPFVIGRDGTRDQVIEKYRAWLQTRPDLIARLPDLRGRCLLCWCAPLRCHGDVLLELANCPDAAEGTAAQGGSA